MLNLYESVRGNPSFNKLEIGGLLFAEYTCPVGTATLKQWSHCDYLIHVISGKKTWHTSDGVWPAKAGETLFFRKGAAMIEQFFEEDFCLLLFFIPDGMIKSTVREVAEDLAECHSSGPPVKSAVRVENDVALAAFFQSMRAYFSGREKPSEVLLRLKLKELVVSILTGRSNRALAAYFQSMAQGDAPSIAEIMEANFRFNLSLDEYAALCHRSLSSFKREFQRRFQEPPGKWLLRRRLEYAAALLRSTTAPVTEIVFESGFEDVSHFSRVFKERFKSAPSAYRLADPAAK
jgi:AraC-like DNA-binding protein